MELYLILFTFVGPNAVFVYKWSMITEVHDRARQYPISDIICTRYLQFFGYIVQSQEDQNHYNNTDIFNQCKL